MENSHYEKLENIVNLATDNLTDYLLSTFNGFDYDYHLLTDSYSIQIEFQIRNNDNELENTFFVNGNITDNKLIMTMEDDNNYPYNKFTFDITDGINDNSIIEKIQFYLNEYCNAEIEYLVDVVEQEQNELNSEYHRERSIMEYQYSISR